jgi:hypothetical protein
MAISMPFGYCSPGTHKSNEIVFRDAGLGTISCDKAACYPLH